MEKLSVLQLMGPTNCNDPKALDYAARWLSELSDAMGIPVAAADEAAFSAQGLPVYFIATGGSALPFSQKAHLTKGPYIIITIPAYNSLPASMEMLSWLRQNGEDGEILRGSPEEVAHRLRILLRAREVRRSFSSLRLGCIGETVGLVASKADAGTLKSTSGADLVMLSLDELITEYGKGGYEENSHTRALKAKGFDAAETEKSLNVYGAVKRMADQYKLDAVTLRCFDLLDAIGTTGCLALAILNADGIPAACEGDTRSLIAMSVLQKLTGESVFMANPSCLEPDSLIFAHCTLPLDMPESYTLTTHFESGLGVAIAGDFKAGPVTVFKCDETMDLRYVEEGQLLESLHRSDLCRTQLRIALPGGPDKLLAAPIANHQMICKGHWGELIEAFFALK